MDWESRYQLGDTPWEKGTAAPPLLEWMKKNGPLRGRVLVPGCGLGHDVRAISAASEEVEVVGIDFAPSAIEQARRVPVVGNEEYCLGNLFDLPPEFENRFDWVFEHTCFCAINPGDRPVYVRSVSRALSRGGQLLGVFFLNPWDPGEEPEGGGPPFAITREELQALFSPEFEPVDEMMPEAAYPDRKGREIVVLLRRT